MIGRLTKPTIAKMELALAAVLGLSKALFKEIYARYKNNKISSDVSLASQTHQVPYFGLPQTAPVTRAIKVKVAPIGAETLATTSAILICQIKPMPPTIAIIK